ncbi:astacin-like metalloendopeptidase [Lissotriton helveticus]
MDVTTAVAIVLSVLHLTLGRPLELVISEQITDSAVVEQILQALTSIPTGSKEAQDILMTIFKAQNGDRFNITSLTIFTAHSGSTELTEAVSSLQKLAEEKSAATNSVKYISAQILESNKGSSIPLLQGDIRRQLTRSAVQCNQCIWPSSGNGTVTVPFILASNFSNSSEALIRAALEEFNTLTCVQFTDRKMETDYLNISSGNGCWSYIGKIGGGQYLSLDEGSCMLKGIIQHEIEQSLGICHEHTRPDRDQYVDILWHNIAEGDWSNFAKDDGNTMDLPYDYVSVMHFDRYAFSNASGQPSMIPKPDPTVAIGQQYGLNNLDVAKVNKLYNCNRCSSLLSDPQGSFSTPNFTEVYQNGTNCRWLIRLPSNKISLQFDDFDVQLTSDCSADFINVYDGGNTSSPVVLKKACGELNLPPLVSSGSMMLVEFVSDGAISARGFNASYRTVTCDSTSTKDNGTVTSPEYPLDYPTNMDCVMAILAPEGYKISLTFTQFDLENFPGCGADYLIINDGARSTSKTIGKYCGNIQIPDLVSTDNALLLQFHSDTWVTAAGFRAEYSFVKAENSSWCTKNPMKMASDNPSLEESTT